MCFPRFIAICVFCRQHFRRGFFLVKECQQRVGLFCQDSVFDTQLCQSVVATRPRTSGPHLCPNEPRAIVVALPQQQGGRTPRSWTRGAAHHNENPPARDQHQETGRDASCKRPHFSCLVGHFSHTTMPRVNEMRAAKAKKNQHNEGATAGDTRLRRVVVDDAPPDERHTAVRAASLRVLSDQCEIDSRYHHHFRQLRLSFLLRLTFLQGQRKPSSHRCV